MKEGRMTDLRDREKGEEAHWSLDQEQAFKVRAMRDRLLGLWAARELGLGDGGALAYACEVANTDVERGQAAMVGKIIGDFGREEIPVPPDAVERQLKACEQEARKRVASLPR
jgi:hypothetical protein